MSGRGFSVPVLPNGGYASGRYYGGGCCSAGSTFVLSANTLYAIPFNVSTGGQLTKIAIEVTTGVAGNARLGVYTVKNGVPDALVADAGTVSTASTGIKEATLSSPLAAGFYALVLVSDGTATVRGINAFPGIQWLAIGGSAMSSQDAGWTCSFSYDALPASFGSASFVNGSGVPWIAAKV